VLGQKRSTSMFAPAEVSKIAPNTTPVETAAPIALPIPDIEENTPAEVVKPIATGRAHNLFFTPEDDSREFSEVLREVQGYIAASYSTLMTGGIDSREQIRRYAAKYIQDKRIAVKGMTSDELVDAIYSEMAEYGFLTKYIFGKGIEEIDINSWRGIEIQYSSGLSEKLKEHFDSPDHAVNVIRRMLHASGVILDNASPVVTGTLSQNIRIAAMKTPVVDESVGVAASIRIVNPQDMTKADFVNGGSATDEMLDFLAACLRYGISVCVAGATSSGKTTVAGWLLTTIPDNKRIFTIENGSREVDLVREQDGQVVNSVVHTLTRDSENERQRITQISLLDISLRFNPDLIFVGEMRGAEANAAQEAARTGVAVLTTIHSNSCEATYRRMVSLCKRAVDMSDATLMDYVTEAYPLVVFCKQLENKQRRLMEIMECEILPDGTRQYNPIFRYHITENRYEDGKYTIEGCHQQIQNISPSLQKRLIDNGMPDCQLQAFLRKEVKTA
jgi:pilus assembly protein CpaF